MTSVTATPRETATAIQFAILATVNIAAAVITAPRGQYVLTVIAGTLAVALLWLAFRCTALGSTLTATDDRLTVRTGLITQIWPWDEVESITLTGRNQADGHLLRARFKDGTHSDEIRLTYWKNTGDHQWAMTIVDSARAHKVGFAQPHADALIMLAAGR